MNAVKSYKFLLRYPAVPDSKQLARLERKVAASFSRQKYREYLSRYNIFCLFDWKTNSQRLANESDSEGNDDERINRRYYWKMFNLGGIENGAEELELQQQQRFSIALKEPVNIRAFEECISLNFINGPARPLQCKFTRTNHLEVIERALSRVNKEPGSHLEVFSLGIRLDVQNEELDYIQPLLEQSHNMYKEFNYEKLVQFAKWERTDGRSTKSQIARRFLHKLAESNLSVPLLSMDGNWLVFKRGSGEMQQR